MGLMSGPLENHLKENNDYIFNWGRGVLAYGYHAFYSLPSYYNLLRDYGRVIYAAVCKTVYVGLIPTSSSKIMPL